MNGTQILLFDFVIFEPCISLHINWFEFLLIFVFSTISLLYFKLIFSFFHSFYLNRKKTITDSSKTGVSVLVPFRNEIKNLPSLLASINQMRYPNDFSEWIFIDDHSDDDSAKYIRSLKNENIKILTLDNEHFGKKKAIIAGVQSAKFEIIAQIDADCTPGQNWLNTIDSYFSNQETMLLLMPVLVKPAKSSIPGQLESLEMMSLIGSSIGSCGMNKPIMANSANIAYRKSLLTDTNQSLNTKVVSGDDMFLLQYSRKFYPGKIVYSILKDSVVYTNQHQKFSDFISQRKRWTSKSIYYQDTFVVYTAFLVFFMSFSIVVSFLIGIFSFKWIYISFLMLGIKSIPDFLLIYRTLNQFEQQGLMKWFVPLQLVYPLYISILVITSFWGTYQWKGRIHRSTGKNSK